VSTQR